MAEGKTGAGAQDGAGAGSRSPRPPHFPHLAHLPPPEPPGPAAPPHSRALSLTPPFVSATVRLWVSFSLAALQPSDHLSGWNLPLKSRSSRPPRRGTQPLSLPEPPLPFQGTTAAWGGLDRV